MTKDEQIKMLKEQRAVLRASNEKFRKELIDKACDVLWDIVSPYVNTSEQCEAIQIAFRKAMTEKTNPLFEQCLANVNPETRADVRRNMDLANLLTWEDVATIVSIYGHTNRLDDNGNLRNQEEFFTDVLRQFNKATK